MQNEKLFCLFFLKKVNKIFEIWKCVFKKDEKNEQNVKKEEKIANLV